MRKAVAILEQQQTNAAKMDAGIPTWSDLPIVQRVAAQLPGIPKEFKGSLPTVEEIEKELGYGVPEAPA